MPLKAKCPNPDCGKVVTAQDVHAGKKAKCPACGGVVQLPKLPKAAPPPPKKERRRKPAPEEIEEEEDLESDEEEEEERPAKQKKVDSNLASILFFAAGISLIVLAAFAPLFTWLSISVKEGDGADAKAISSIVMSGTGKVERKDEARGATQSKDWTTEGKPEGMFLLILCLVVAILLTVGFLLAISGVMQRKLSEQILNATLLAGLGFGILLTIWSLAWFWKVVTFSHTMQKGLEEVRVGTRTAEFAIRPFPGIGLFIQVLAGLFLAYLFSQVASRLNKLRKQLFLAEKMKGVSRQAVEKLYMGNKLLRIAEAVGVLMGGIILALIVKPWEAEGLWKGLEAFIRQQ